LTEEENEDSDPGGTSVLRATCLEHLFGPEWIFLKFERLKVLNDRRKAGFIAGFRIDRNDQLGMRGVVSWQ